MQQPSMPQQDQMAAQQQVQQQIQQQVQQQVQQVQQQVQQVQQQIQQQVQQQQQPMMMCPVRVVYETQMLMPPGDQMQSNQALFINPQNPPPWAQSRPVQNQVIYVQQMPNNIVPSFPQHIDQNQLYLHQYPYQQGVQVIPQQMVQSIQDRNAIQMPNLIQQNMLQNFQNLTQIPQNITLPDRIQNYGQIHPSLAQSIQIQPQHQLIANNVIRTNEAMTSLQSQQQTQFNSPKVEIKQMLLSGGHVATSNNNKTQSQVLSVNPIQNMPTTTNIQTSAPNLTRPVKTESVASQITPPTYVNASQNTHISRIRKLSPNNAMNKINPPNIGLKCVGQTQTYKPIQPRPQQFNQLNSMPIINQTVINVNSNVPITVNPNTGNVLRSEEHTPNRKRKSESPDEIHKKMAAIQVNVGTPAPLKQISDVKRMDTGINANPPQRNEVTITPSILQPNNVKIHITTPGGVNNEMQFTDVKSISNIMQNVQNACVPSLDPIEPQINTQQKEVPNTAQDKDKLYRNTVFTQARSGRVLNDTDTLATLLAKESIFSESVNSLKEITITPKDPIIKTNKEVKLDCGSEPLTKKEKNNKPVPRLIKKDQDTKPVPNLIKKEKKPVSVKEQLRERLTKNITVFKDETKGELKSERKDNEDMKVSLNTTNNKGMFPVERGVKKERDYILTHVLDGIVIQESNVAFPIREPLIKRITQSTALNTEMKKGLEKEKSIEDSPKREEINRSQTKEAKDKGVAQGDNPFAKIDPATVKSWTTEELSSHLFQHGWSEEAALLSEHEIDGESLHLVSKAQLLTIGIEEAHADALCGFVKM